MTEPRRFWSSHKGQGEVVKWLREHAGYESHGCLIFPFCRNPQKGYGMVGLEGKQLYAHRYMCELVNGPPPTPRAQARHSCGNGHLGCVHPKHLLWGSNSKNQIDRYTHGTVVSHSGTRTKLTTEQVAEIRALKGLMTQIEIAKKIGVKIGVVEYWQRHDRPPNQPGTSSATIYRRRKAAQRAAVT